MYMYAKYIEKEVLNSNYICVYYVRLRVMSASLEKKMKLCTFYVRVARPSFSLSVFRSFCMQFTYLQHTRKTQYIRIFRIHTYFIRAH